MGFIYIIYLGLRFFPNTFRARCSFVLPNCRDLGENLSTMHVSDRRKKGANHCTTSVSEIYSPKVLPLSANHQNTPNLLTRLQSFINDQLLRSPPSKSEGHVPCTQNTNARPRSIAPVLYGDNYAAAAHVAVCVRAHVCPSPLHIRGEKVEHAVAYMYACRCSVDLRDGTEGNSIDALCTGQLSSGGASKGKVIEVCKAKTSGTGRR